MRFALPGPAAAPCRCPPLIAGPGTGPPQVARVLPQVDLCLSALPTFARLVLLLPASSPCVPFSALPGQEDLLHEAASRGDVEVLRALLDAAGSSALGRTDGRGLGRTPLHSAAIHRQAAAAELLIAAHLHSSGVVGATAPAERKQEEEQASGQEGDGEQTAGQTAVPAAPASGLDAADSQGFTALHWAAMTGSNRILRCLLAAGARLEAVAADGMTPLHLAAKAGHSAAVQALLKAGSSVTGEAETAARLGRCRGASTSFAEVPLLSFAEGPPPRGARQPASATPTLPPHPPSIAALDDHGCLPLHYIALRGDLALFVLLFSPSAPSLAAQPAAAAALLTAAIRGGSSEMVGIVLLTGATTPQVGGSQAGLAARRDAAWSMPATACCGRGLWRGSAAVRAKCCPVT